MAHVHTAYRGIVRLGAPASGGAAAGGAAATSSDAVTSYAISGPAGGAAGAPSAVFTVTTTAAWSGTITITPSGGGLSTPIVLPFASETSKTFTITPTAAGTVSLTPTSSPQLGTDPAPLSYVATASGAATAYTFTGPSGGAVNAQSTAFTVTPDGTYTGAVTVTPSGGGLSTPVVLTWSGTSDPKTFTITPTSTGLVTLTPTSSPQLGTDPLALEYASAQLIDSAWRTANATAFGGDASSGPWVLGKAFGAYSLPNAANGFRPYIVGDNLSASATAFVLNDNVQLDLAGHEVTWDDDVTQPGSFNGEFESDADGAAPAGWDLSGCIEAVPAVFQPTAHGHPINMLFGDKVLGWSGANKVPAGVAATLSLDGSNNVTFTVSGTAPANDRQVFPFGYVATGFTSGRMYYVVNSSGSTFQVSNTKAGSPVTATSVSGAAGTVGYAQVIRTTNPVTIPKAGVWYGFKHAMSSCETGTSWAANLNKPVCCIGRVYDAVTGNEVAWTQIAYIVEEGDPRASGGYRPFCYPMFWKPANTNSVYLEIAVACSDTSCSVAVDAIRLARALNYGVYVTSLHTGSIPGSEILPTAMQWGQSSGYNKAGNFKLVDSVGGGGFNQGANKSLYGTTIMAVSSTKTIAINGKTGDKMNMTVTGDNASFLYALLYTGASVNVSDVNCVYGTGVDVMNRQHATPGFNLGRLTTATAMSFTRVNASNVPQNFLGVNSDSNMDQQTTLIDSCVISGNCIVSNCYLIVPAGNFTMTNTTMTGKGYAISFYTPGASDLTEIYSDIRVSDCTFDMDAVAEREYGFGIGHRCIKFKNVAPGPWEGFRDIWFDNVHATARATNGINRQCYPISLDIRNGNNVGGSGNFRFTNCTFESLVDATPPVAGGTMASSAVEYDECDPGNFPVFYQCTLISSNYGVYLNGVDGTGCHGSALIDCTFKYNNVQGIATDAYQLVSIGANSIFPVGDLWIIDPVIDASVTSGHDGVYWSGGNSDFGAVCWNIRLLDGGEGYTAKPTFTSPNPPGTQGIVVAMGSDGTLPAGAVASVGRIRDPYPATVAGFVNQSPLPQVTFSGGSPTVAATAELILIGNTWPFRDYRYGSCVKLTVTEADGVTPIAGAAVVVTDNLGNQIFPLVPGSLNTDGTSNVPATTNANGEIGIADNVPVIPLPRTRVTQGDSVAKQTSAYILGTTSLDASTQNLTQGVVTGNSITSYTIQVSKTGYTTYSNTISPPASRLDLNVEIS